MRTYLANLPPDLPLFDTPETRAWLETLAIPRCQAWREANPEVCLECTDGEDPAPWCDCRSDERCKPNRPCRQRAHSRHPAPYCCSAYCARCAGLRQLDHEPALIPNAWIFDPSAADIYQPPPPRPDVTPESIGWQEVSPNVRP